MVIAEVVVIIAVAAFKNIVTFAAVDEVSAAACLDSIAAAVAPDDVACDRTVELVSGLAAVDNRAGLYHISHIAEMFAQFSVIRGECVEFGLLECKIILPEHGSNAVY